MAPFTPEAVKAIRVRRLQPLHALYKIALWRLQSEMKVVAHEAIRVHYPLTPARSLDQGVFK